MTGPLAFRAAGLRAVLVEFEDLTSVRDYYAEALRRRAAGELDAGIELVPAARTLLFDRVADTAALVRSLPDWQPPPAAERTAREIEIPTRYDGPDLADVARLWDISESELVDLHAGIRHEVAFIGFAPGFAYLTGIPASRPVPRRATPRPNVPAGSVAMAGLFTGIYPRQSPGGWALIGRTELCLWSIDRDPPATLLPGDRVRFIPVRL
jgi:KipI family sensor histidine kinase inhibitor